MNLTFNVKEREKLQPGSCESAAAVKEVEDKGRKREALKRKSLVPDVGGQAPVLIRKGALDSVNGAFAGGNGTHQAAPIFSPAGRRGIRPDAQTMSLGRRLIEVWPKVALWAWRAQLGDVQRLFPKADDELQPPGLLAPAVEA